MKFQRESSTTLVSLFILVLFYLVLIVLILFFSQYIITHISTSSNFTNALAVFIIIILPLALIGAIGFQIAKLIKERVHRKVGSRLKTRLLVFFLFIALLSLVPQALLSISFINSAINFWFNAKIGQALDSGKNIAIEFFNTKVNNLNQFKNSYLLPYLIDVVGKSPAKAWQNIHAANPEINFFQVFNSDGEEIFFEGDPSVKIVNFDAVRSGIDASPVKEVRGEASLIRVVLSHKVSNVVYYFILGIQFPKSFDEQGANITQSLRVFKQLFQYKDLFRFVIVFFYFLFSFPILLLTILVSFLLTEEIIRPIVHLEEATRRVSEGDFSFRILTRSEDELSALVGSFNKMLAELEHSRRKLVQAEKISAWKEIAQRLAHEIKNPLTPIKLSAQRVMKKYYESNDDEFEKVLNNAVSAIINEVENLNALLEEFREFTKLPDPRFEPTNIEQLIHGVRDTYKNLAPNVKWEVKTHQAVKEIWVDANQLKQVFANLVKNAYQAMPDGGKISIHCQTVKKDNLDYCRIQIRDTGKGIASDIKDKLFEPYFTTKKDGSGLGLAIVERIIFDHNGSIWFESQQDAGTTFFIDLPIRKNHE